MRFTAIKTIPGYFPINSFSSDHSFKPEITSSSQDSAQDVAPYCTGQPLFKSAEEDKEDKEEK